MMILLGLINMTTHSDKTLKAVDMVEGQNPKSDLDLDLSI